MTKFSLFYLISLILDDFGTFCLLNFGSFQFLLMIHFGLLASIFVNFESF